MSWLLDIRKILFPKDRELELRQSPVNLPTVEHLEARLCLGSMHNSSVADWTDDLLEETPADEVMLANRLEISQQLDWQESDVEEVSSVDTSADVNYSETLLPDYSPTSPTLISPDVSSALYEQQINNYVSGQPLGSTVMSGVSLTEQPVDGANGPSATSLSSQTVGESDQQSGAVATGPAGVNSQASFAPNTTQSSAQALDAATLATFGLRLDDQGNAVGLAHSTTAAESGHGAWWTSADEAIVIRYDFRDQNGAENVITEEQKARTVEALQRWSDATEGKIVFQQDTEAQFNEVINIGVGQLSIFGYTSAPGDVLSLAGGQVVLGENGRPVASGVVWLDQTETWDNTLGNGNPTGTVDFTTAVAHEIGHALGYADTSNDDIMNGRYTRERLLDEIDNAVNNDYFYRTLQEPTEGDTQYELHALTIAMSQLSAADVELLLNRAAAASASNDAIIAIVDRNARVLGVRVEADALAAIPDAETLVFAIDGAIAKARTAALFSNGNPINGTLAPLTSRTIRFISQSTVTQREVESNPNVDRANAATAAASTTRGPGFVAPIGVGAHFPPEIAFTPPVDLFAIEHTNRDSNLSPGPDGVKGTADDIALRTGGGGTGRFNIDPAFVPAGQELVAPESYGAAQNSGILPEAQSRGIATLPGGIPLFRDSNADGFGDTLVGGIGVFFPGADGYATHEQGFIPGIGQSEASRTNAPRVLEAEYIAFAAAGGSLTAQQQFGVQGAKILAINGVAPVANLDLPFGRLDLVGITLQVYGPIAGKGGVEQLVAFGNGLGVGNAASGADQPLIGGVGGLYRAGEVVPEGWLVTPHDSLVDPITAADVTQVINQGILAANEVRAAVRLPLSSRTRMVFAVTDTTGEVLGLFRMRDATTFSIDVAVAKARNVAYYADPADIVPIDQVTAAGTAFSNRTFRFLSQPRFPSGINGTTPPPFSILNDGSINNLTGENIAGPDTVSEFDSVLGNDAFFPMSNFRDPGDAGVVGGDVANQNGVVFFPGSTPLYESGVLIGGLGVSGDGVDQDDVVTYVAALGRQAEGNAVRADQTFVNGVRLPFQKFLRNPFG